MEAIIFPKYYALQSLTSKGSYSVTGMTWVGSFSTFKSSMKPFFFQNYIQLTATSHPVITKCTRCNLAHATNFFQKRHNLDDGWSQRYTTSTFTGLFMVHWRRKLLWKPGKCWFATVAFNFRPKFETFKFRANAPAQFSGTSSPQSFTSNTKNSNKGDQNKTENRWFSVRSYSNFLISYDKYVIRKFLFQSNTPEARWFWTLAHERLWGKRVTNISPRFIFFSCGG